MTIRITEGELRDALTAAMRSDAPADALTVAEMADTTGASPELIRRTLQRLQREGRLTLHHVPRTRIDGQRATVPAYTIAPAPNAIARKRS